jgi:glycosyltransferase involved in cell wall biosynthesis
MKLHILCEDGSPLGVTLRDLWGEGNRGIGIGGSEYALLTMCEEWHKAGHEVILYNNPLTANGSPFEQRNKGSFDPNEDRDVLIVFRSPNPRSIAAKGLKVWWSCDQETIGDFAHFATTVHKVVCISPRHAQYFAERYGIHKTTVIDIPVRIGDYDRLGEVEKIKNRLIFTSVPARGLDNLIKIYPKIQQAIPDVSLAITSDYRLWGCPASNEHFRSKWSTQPNVSFFGALPREKYNLELMKAQILLYPCEYDELFCVSVAEAQYAGAYPITSNAGALPTTNMGTVLEGDVRIMDRFFVDAVVNMLKDPEGLKRAQDDVRQKAMDRFNPDRILKEWDEKIFK